MSGVGLDSNDIVGVGFVLGEKSDVLKLNCFYSEGERRGTRGWVSGGWVEERWKG